MEEEEEKEQDEKNKKNKDKKILHKQGPLCWTPL